MLSHRTLSVAALLTILSGTSFAPRVVSAEVETTAAIGLPPGDLTPTDGEHPLEPIIRWGKASAEKLRLLEGYTCTLVRRERLGGKLRRPRWFALKVRHQPFAVYLGSRERNGRRGDEAIFIEGRNDDMMWAHADRYRHLGTVSLYPDGRRAMKEARYPITEVGILNLIERLVEVAEKDLKYDECEVKVYDSAKLQSRPCWCITVTHPIRRRHFRFHLARVWIDQQLCVPVRYESYTWPREPGGRPVLMEEYTHLNFQFNPRFDDSDFDIRSAEYDFREKGQQPAGELARSRPAAPSRAAGEPRQALKPTAAAHSIDAVLEMARRSLKQVEAIRDYSCVFARREEVDGQLRQREYMAIKVRHEPFSVYTFCLGPARPEGEEAIYVRGTNDDRVVAHSTGLRGRLAGTMSLQPKSRLLMAGSLHPMTELGIKNLLIRVIKIYDVELEYDDARVTFYHDRKINDRPCTCAQVVHPVKRPGRRFGLTRLFVDNERGIPVRFEAYGWPEQPGSEPPLIEEYTYLDVRLNRDLTDVDFDIRNPDYAFDAGAKQREESEAAPPEQTLSGPGE